jgi:pilus assembly protein Flp/PilA
MFSKIIDYLNDEDGQTSTEYILLVAVVALIVFKFKKTAQGKLTELTEGVFNKANDKILSEMDEP